MAFVVGALAVLNQQYLGRSVFNPQLIGQAVAQGAVSQQVEVYQGEPGSEFGFFPQQTPFCSAADAATGAVFEKKNGVLIGGCQQLIELDIVLQGYPAHDLGVLAGRGRSLTESRAGIAVARAQCQSGQNHCENHQLFHILSVYFQIGRDLSHTIVSSFLLFSASVFRFVVRKRDKPWDFYKPLPRGNKVKRSTKIVFGQIASYK